MPSIETVGVRELRQNLSVYLDRVKQGETLTVTEHRQVVAILRPAHAADNPVEQLVRDGRAAAARRSGRPQPLRVRLTTPLSRALGDLRRDTI